MDAMVPSAILILTGITAGFSSGLMGVGGCFLMVPVQYWLLSAPGLDSTLATRVAFGTGLAVTLPTAITAAWGHHRRGAVDWQAAVPMGAAAVIGALLGGTLAAWTPGHLLRTAFALVVLLMAARMLADLRECRVCPVRRGPAVFALLGLAIGLISGLAGIGGGTVAVPLMVLLVGFPMHRAVGTSSATLIFSAAGAVAAYIYYGLGMAGLPPGTLGYVYLPWWALLTATTVPLSLLGVRAAHRLDPQRLRGVFALVLAAIGLVMLLPR